MSRTQTAMMREPPDGGGVAVGNEFPDDVVVEIGDRIAALKPTEAAQLAAYLKSLGISSPLTPLDLLWLRFPDGLPWSAGLKSHD